MNTNLNSTEVSQYATANNIDRYTAMAMVNAKMYEIKPHEIEAYMSRFHQYMNDRYEFQDAIHHALMNIILSAGFQKIEAAKPVTIELNPMAHYQFPNN